MKVQFNRHFKKYKKYRNKTCHCRQGHLHDSIKEANYCNELELMKKAGEIEEYKSQVKFDLRVNDQKVCAMIVDFLVTTAAGDKEVHEVKSKITMTSTWNVKRKLFEALHEDINYVVIR